MKFTVTILLTTLSLSSFAASGDMGGGRSFTLPKSNLSSAIYVSKSHLTIPNTELEAIISKGGIYARPIEIQEGFERFRGIRSDFRNTTIEFQRPNHLDIDSIILIDGTIINIGDIQGKHGGDMGGG
jgi:hypothetical protein